MSKARGGVFRESLDCSAHALGLKKALERNDTSMKKSSASKNQCLLGALVIALSGLLANRCWAGYSARPSDSEYGPDAGLCLRAPWFCTDPIAPNSLTGEYVGHDEPALLFYSSVPGSGNSGFYTVILPKDPPTLPAQDGAGGTFNFQLRAAFWFGLAACDNQSSPQLNSLPCTPDTDANIFDNADPAAPDYIGKHPGTAYVELQFYPPGWKSIIGCDGTHWCSGLTITSASNDPNTGTRNNTDCLTQIGGDQPFNFAYVTRSGVSDSPASPLNKTRMTFNPATDIVFNPGDTVTIQITDTPEGIRVVETDLTTGATGSMTASVANGYSQIAFQPTAPTCTAIPYAFHPMYSTSNEHTRVPWAAHSYNVAFSDEIGHFEYCNAIDEDGDCIFPGVDDPGKDSDDKTCFDTNGMPGLVPLIGCIDDDLDFDSPPYQLVWPGTDPNAGTDAQFHPEPVLFTSPTFQSSAGSGRQGYDRVAFETNLSQIEIANQGCDLTTGSNCSNPARGTDFYPFFSTRPIDGQCYWQIGGAFVPGSTNTFGGSSAAAYGPLTKLLYPATGGPAFLFTDFHQSLDFNPCQAGGGQSAGKISAPAPITVKKGAGQHLEAGSFRYKNTSSFTQRIGTVAVTVSNPAVLASLTIAASGSSATVSPVNASNALSFPTPVTVAPGATLSFKITAELATSSTAAANGLILAALTDRSAGQRGGKAPWGAGLLLIGLMVIPAGGRKRKALIALAGLTLMVAFVACGGSGGSPASSGGISAAVTTNGGLSGTVTLSTVSVSGGGTSSVQQLTGLGFQ